MTDDIDRLLQRIAEIAKALGFRRRNRTPTQTPGLSEVDSLVVNDEYHRLRVPLNYDHLIYDPAYGTGGFLIHALQHLSDTSSAADRDLSPAEKVQILEAQRCSAQRMAKSARKTALASLTDRVIRLCKRKPLDMTQEELENHIAELLRNQDARCAISGLPYQLDNMAADPELLCSLDRKDSKEGYVRGNLQIVCRFINRWKSSSDDQSFRRLINPLKSGNIVSARQHDERRLHRL